MGRPPLRAAGLFAANSSSNLSLDTSLLASKLAALSSSIDTAPTGPTLAESIYRISAPSSRAGSRKGSVTTREPAAPAATVLGGLGLIASLAATAQSAPASGPNTPRHGEQQSELFSPQRSLWTPIAAVGEHPSMLLNASSIGLPVSPPPYMAGLPVSPMPTYGGGHGADDVGAELGMEAHGSPYSEVVEAVAMPATATAPAPATPVLVEVALELAGADEVVADGLLLAHMAIVGSETVAGLLGGHTEYAISVGAAAGPVQRRYREFLALHTTCARVASQHPRAVDASGLTWASRLLKRGVFPDKVNVPMRPAVVEARRRELGAYLRLVAGCGIPEVRAAVAAFCGVE